MARVARGLHRVVGLGEAAVDPLELRGRQPANGLRAKSELAFVDLLHAARSSKPHASGPTSNIAELCASAPRLDDRSMRTPIERSGVAPGHARAMSTSPGLSNRRTCSSS